MADNLQTQAITDAGATIATDEIGGVHYPVSKIALGADGSATHAVGGAGSVSAAVQRTTLASDDPAVTSLAAIKTAAELIDDTIKTDDAAFSGGSDKVLVVGGVASPMLLDPVDQGDAGALRMTVNRDLHVNPRDSSGNEITNFGTDQYPAGHTMDSSEGLIIPAGMVAESPGTGRTDGLIYPLLVGADGRLHMRDDYAKALLTSIYGSASYLDLVSRAEDSAHSSGQYGFVSLGVRRDADTSPVDVTGDYHNFIFDAAGNLKVNAKIVALPTGASTLAEQQSQTTALGLLLSDSNFNAKIGSLTETAPATDTASSGLNGRLQRLAQRITSLIALFPTSLGQKTKANSFAVAIASDQDALPITDNSGSLTCDVAGQVAHDAAVSGNPVLIAARANANEPTAVSADADVTHLWADLFGRLVVLPGHPNPENPVAVNVTNSGDNDVIAAPGASLSLYICKVSINNAGSSNIVVALQEESSATDRWRMELASEGGGALIDFGARGWKLGANKKLQVNLGAGGDVNVNVTEYYIAA